MKGAMAFTLASVAFMLAVAPVQAQVFWPWQSRTSPPPPVYLPPARTAPSRPAVNRPATTGSGEPQQRSRIEPNAAGTAAKPDGAKPLPPIPEGPPPVYEPKLLRLSELMGALAFLRPLCGNTDGSDWRTRMTALIEAEATTTPRRERLAGAYNKGYRGLSLTYRRCTPNAELLMSRYLDEGSKLVRELSSRYGG
jgi:uncharacterized protein (TIGR02301 family)